MVMPDSELLPQGGQMKRIVIIGAGQMGRALHKMPNPSETEFLCFGDNDASKWTDGEGSFCRKSEAGHDNNQRYGRGQSPGSE